MKEAYQITILSKDRFFPDEELIHTFQYYDPVHGVSLDGKTRIVIMELVKAGQVIEKPVDKMSGYEAWAAFLGYLTDIEKREKINEIVRAKEGIAMASEAMTTISPSDREYFLRLSEEKYILDKKTKEHQAERKLAKAMAEGMEKGMAEGMEKGIAEGRAEGKAEASLDFARKLKARGRPIAEIAEDTGLSIKDIENF